MSQPATDPITAVLLIVTELRGDVKSALETLKRHDGTLEQHARTLVDHGNRITALETVDARDGQNDARTYSGKALAWSIVAACAAVATVLLYVLLAVKG